MTNEYNEEVVDSTTDDTVEETANETETVTEETPKVEETKEVKKVKRTPEEELKYFEGRAKRLRKELGIEETVKASKDSSSSETSETKSDLDYGEKAYLRSFDIKGSDEIALVKNWVKRTGDGLDVVVEDEIFLAKLAKLRENKNSINAMPKGNQRSNVVNQDEAYWTSKIESGQAKLNDIPDVNIKRNVLNKRIEKERSGNKFSSQPIVMG